VYVSEGNTRGAITYREISGLFELLQFARDNTQYGYNVDIKPRFVVPIR